MITLKKIVLGILMFISCAVIAQELYYIQPDANYIRFREPDIIMNSGKLMISVESLREFGAGVTSFPDSKKAYLINETTGDTLVIDPVRGLLKNFMTPVEGTVINESNTLYLASEPAFDFLGFDFMKGDGITSLNRYYAYKQEDIIKLENAVMNLRTVHLDFSSSFFSVDDIIKVNTKGKEAEITVFPADASDSLIRGLILERSDDFFVKFNLDFNVPVDYRIMKEDKRVSIYFSHVDPYLEEIEVLSPGIQWYRKREKFGHSRLRVSYIEIDTEKADVHLTPEISRNGLGTREKLSTMVRRNLAIGGVNGSYFDPTTNLPVGLLIKSGEIESEPFYYPRPLFVRTKDNGYYILEIDTEIHIRLGGSLFLVKGINKFSKNGDVIVYTDKFGKTVPQMANREYVVISDSQVISKSYTPRVPKGGMVVMFSPADIAKFIKNGDVVDVELKIPGFPYEIEDAIEGGPPIIMGGKLVEGLEGIKSTYGQKIITGKTPRTVLALSPDRIVLMVIDGYQSESSGLTYEELANFLLKKGFTDAMCFDGGSSSTMVIGNRVVNYPSGGEPNIPVGIIIERNK